MTPQHYSSLRSLHLGRQKGVVLFFALIALLVMSLASVALVRSVDTSNAIAGNLAFKQAATTSADAGIEAAIATLITMRDAAANGGKKVLSNATHTFNKTETGVRPGYHSSADPALNLSDVATWNDVNNRVLPIDTSGNTVQYIMQRMCRTKDTEMQAADCLYAAAADDTGDQSIKAIQDICEGSGCFFGSQTPRVRVTVRVLGPKNTISFVQAFIY